MIPPFGRDATLREIYDYWRYQCLLERAARHERTWTVGGVRFDGATVRDLGWKAYDE